MQNTITEIFDKWIEGPVSQYNHAGQGINKVAVDNNSKRSTLNLFLRNEADIRIKFGGFLEQELLSSDGGLTVHAEQNVGVDRESLYRTDLSVHEIVDSRSLGKNEGPRAADTIRLYSENAMVS